MTCPRQQIRKTLRAQFSPVALAVEADYIAGPGRTSQRPYGWGWALALVHEAWRWDDPEGSKWAAAMAPLADTITGCFLDWLPKATYPVRCGVHTNSAFGLSRALGYAQLRAATGDPALLEAIAAKAFDWFAGDTFYPGGWEPSGQDFLSPALTEAELMAQILPQGEFADWLSFFLPGIAGGEPASLFTPVSFPTPATARSPTCTGSTRAGPGAGGGSRSRSRPATRGSSPPRRPRGPTPMPHCRTSSATTTWSSTGSPAMRSSCSADATAAGATGAGPQAATVELMQIDHEARPDL